MASQITLILWTDHAPDVSLASDLAQQAAAQVYRSSGLAAAVISATATDIQVHDIEAAVQAFADAEAPQEVAVSTPMPPAPVLIAEPTSDAPTIVTPEPQPVNAEGTPIPAPDVAPPAVDPSTTAASAGLVSAPLPDPTTQIVDSDEHMAVLVQLFEALSPEQKAELDAEVHTLEDAHAALERIYAPLVALETPPA